MNPPFATIDDYPELYRYRFCPRCATPLERSQLHELERLRCPACGWVFYPEPQIAATVVIEHADGIVLVQRDIEPDRGIWHLPIGHAEFGEEPVDAALREGTEETGLLLAEPRFLSFTHGRSYGDTRMFYIVFAFAARAVGGELVGGDEGRNTRIVPLDQMPQLKWTSQAEAIRAYRNSVDSR